MVDLKLPLEERDGQFFTRHPQFPDQEFQIESNEFIGVGYGSPTPACNVFDWLALYFDNSYEKGIDFCIDSYHNLAQVPIGISIGSIRDHMVDSLKDARRQFEEILALRDSLRYHDERLTNAYLYCRRLGLSPDHGWRMFYVATGKQLNKILHYPTDDTDRLETNKAYLVFPFFKNRHTFAMLQIREDCGKLVKTVDLNPSRYMFFGLHSCLPDNRETRVFANPEDALVMHSHAMQQGDFRLGFVSVGFNPSADPEPSPLRSGTFMITDPGDFNTIVKNRMAFDEFSVADYAHRFADTLEVIPWTRYALNAAIVIINEDMAYTPRLAMTVESLKTDPEVFNRFISYLEQLGQQIILNRLKRHVDTQQVFSIGSMTITETVSGYVAKKSGTNVTSHFTNFLIKIDCSLWFDESQETYYSGRVILNGNHVPFLLSSLASKQAKSIITLAEQAVQQAGIISEVNLPTITDTTLQSKLVDIINLQKNNKPRRVGVQRLGWNPTKTRFITPNWEAHTLGVQGTSRVVHPDSTIITSFYNTRDYRLVTKYDAVTPQARYLIALVAASMTRSFLNQQTPTITLIRSPQSLALLAAVFRPLGQISPIELSPNRRSVMDTLSARNMIGYPIYATCPDIDAVSNFNYPLFLLSESGFPLHEPITEESALQTTSLSHRIISSLALDFVRDKLQAHSLIENENAPSIKELALEGKRVIEARCGIDKFDLFEPEMPLLQAVLSQIPSDQANEHFRYDLSTGTVYIRCRTLKDVTRKPLYDELVAKNPAVETHSDHYIACPAAWFVDLLSKFYGKHITLYHQNPDPGAPKTTEEQDCSGRSTT